jgi:hypothetical protein
MSRCHTINLSAGWEPPAVGGRTWIRRFGRPGGLSGERLWLVIDRPAVVSATLNDVPLPAIAAADLPAADLRNGAYRAEITGLLTARNTLALIVTAERAAAVVSAPHGRCRLPETCGRVRLEIDADATPAG